MRAWLVASVVVAACGGGGAADGALGGGGGGADVASQDAGDSGADAVVSRTTGDSGVGEAPEDSTVLADGEGAADAGDGGSWGGGDTGPRVYPDPSFVHVEKSAPVDSASAPYLADVAHQFRTTTALPDLDARAVAVGAGVWVGTPSGLYRLEGTFVLEAPGAVVDLAPQGDSVVVLREGDVELADGAVVSLPTGEWVAVASGEGGVWVGGSAGLLHVTDIAEGTPVTVPVRDVAVDAGGTAWVATAQGVRAVAGEQVVVYDAAGGALLDDDVRAVVCDPVLGTWAGTATGVSRLDSPAHLPAGKGGLPADDVRSLAVYGDRLIIGHGVGATAIRVGDGATDHWCGLRWLPSDQVRAVAAGEDVWVATASGVSRVRWEERSLGGVAAAFEEQIEEFWRMDGFVAPDAWLDDPWDPSGLALSDSDNDGLWTQMQVGAFCYAYAATGDVAFKEKARKAAETMRLLVDVPALDFELAGLGRGFVARSLVRDDEGWVFSSKAESDRWHLVEYEGRQYRWKDDTSSDEYAGHFFGWPLYYDLCADDEEKAQIADLISDVAGYLVDHGLKLIDLDGQKTTFGHWHPEQIAAAAGGVEPCLEAAALSATPFEAASACIASWYGEGWLNSIEILGHLLAAWHITGEQRFYDAYDELVRAHGYGEVAMPHADTFTITNPNHMNHSDHELAMLSYHTLIRYEPDPERRALWIESLLFLYEHERVERNPLWVALVALAAGPASADVEAGIQSLREMPLDRRELWVDTSHRKDATDWPLDRFDKPQWQEVFAYDEIRTIWWNGNFHVKQHGGEGHGLSGPMAWLLPYWALRYSGLLGE